MSVLGHSRHNRRCPKSTFVRFTPLATLALQCSERSEVPLATNAPQQTAPLFDHLVGERQKRRRYFEAERLGSLEVEYEFEFGGLYDRQVGRFLAL
jgi:hypothetical protein